jgi:hypothetical protein
MLIILSEKFYQRYLFMIQIKLLHKEPDEKCFEILKSAIVEVKELKKFKIEKDTLLKNLPEELVNEFLDFLGPVGKHRNLTLQLIKEGRIILHCWDDNHDDDWRD